MRQVQGSKLIDNVSMLEALADLMDVRRTRLKLELLFSTRNSGWRDASAFHSSCDNKGPTIVLLTSSDGHSYGGYTSVSWTQSGNYQADQQAFLFRITPTTGPGTKRSFHTEKFSQNLNSTTRSTYSDTQCGPAFGAGPDLATFSTRELTLSSKEKSYSTLGPLINTTVPKSEANFQLEVLQMTIDPNGAASELDQPWLADVCWNVKDGLELQKDVLGFSPIAEGLPVKHINLLLCGGVGAGKSSIVSTIDSLCQGRISRRAPHGQGTGSLTRKLRKYEFINPDSKKTVHWQLWDSMGWGASDYKKGELGFVLDGNLPNKCKLDDNISMKTSGFNRDPSIEDAVHCMCLVVPCEAATDDSYMSRPREMRQFARDREIPTLVFLTKIDNYDPDVIGQDLKKTFHSERLLCLMEELEESSGVGGRKDILPIKNLSQETAPTSAAGVLVCRALQQALYAAVDYLRECDEMQVHEEDAELG